MRKGPHVLTVREEAELVCTGCEYLKMEMIRSGRNPLFDCTCQHPQATAEMVGGARGEGGWIGHFESRPTAPDFCPELKRNKEAAK
ncbi:MAG TPA: hypothetical protein VEC99_11940 [Clostridia bacterium]|nr:hypothetical protein [Clostridia bacterium]